jgi:tRNA A-37 threonylcarbamoyl transferase component Bud32
MNVPSRLVHAVLLPVGRLLSQLRLHDITIVSENSRPFVVKRRRRLASLTIRLANLCLRWEHVRVRVLSDRDWKQREIAMAMLMKGEPPRIGPRGELLLPHRAGRPLSEWLAETELSIETKCRFVTAAARALAELHDLHDPATGRAVSHGDGTARNVLVDPADEAGTAAWIDFDTAHINSAEEDWRKADDLRALLCSAAAALPPETYGELFRAVADGYGQRESWERLANHLERMRLRPTLFHLAQAPLDWRRLSRLVDELAQSVDRTAAEGAANVAGTTEDRRVTSR